MCGECLTHYPTGTSDSGSTHFYATTLSLSSCFQGVDDLNNDLTECVWTSRFGCNVVNGCVDMTRRGHASLAMNSAAAVPDRERPSAPPVSRDPPRTTERTSALHRRPEEIARLRERLIAQQYRARDLFKSPWLRLSGTAPLILLADRALGLIKRVQATLERSDSLLCIPEATASDFTNIATLDGWLQETEDALSEMTGQYSWLETTCRLADDVREVAGRLLKEERVSYSDLMPLATQVFDSVIGIHSPEELFPLPGLQVASIYHGRQACVRPATYTQGVQSARFAAWVIAALLQDVGWLALQPYVADSNRRGPRRASWLAQQHPQIGAAILAAVNRIPLVLPHMVALHHERLDGSGFPRRLSGSLLSRMGRMLACTARTYELYEELSSDGRAGGLIQHVQRMGDGLRHEAKCGWWEPGSVFQLVSAIPKQETAVPEYEAESGKLPPAMTSERTLELHGEQTTPPGSHTHGPAQQGSGMTTRHGMHHSHLN